MPRHVIEDEDEDEDKDEMKENMRFAVLKAGTANPGARERLGDCGEMFISLLSEPGETWDIYERSTPACS